MDVTGIVSDDCNTFVPKRPLGLVGNLSAVKPHCFSNESSVVCQHSVIYIDIILRVQGCQYHINILQRYSANDKSRRGIDRCQRNAFARSGSVAGFEPKRLHSLNRFSFPVRNYIAFIFIQPEMSANIDVKIVLIAMIAEQGVARFDILR